MDKEETRLVPVSLHDIRQLINLYQMLVTLDKKKLKDYPKDKKEMKKYFSEEEIKKFQQNLEERIEENEFNLKHLKRVEKHYEIFELY